MTTFRIDPAPAGPVWVMFGDPTRAERVEREKEPLAGDTWSYGGSLYAWHELLAIPGATVTSHHPALPDGSPLPWTARYDDEDILRAYDATGGRVDLTADDVVEVTVKAVNAYAEQLADRGRAEQGERLSPALATATRNVAELWARVTPERRAAVGFECGTLDILLDTLADRYDRQREITRRRAAAAAGSS